MTDDLDEFLAEQGTGKPADELAHWIAWLRQYRKLKGEGAQLAADKMAEATEPDEDPEVGPRLADMIWSAFRMELDELAGLEEFLTSLQAAKESTARLVREVDEQRERIMDLQTRLASLDRPPDTI